MKFYLVTGFHGGCFYSGIYPTNFGHKTHKFVSARDRASGYTLKILEEDGTCLVKYRLITSEHSVHHIADMNIKKILKRIFEAKGYMCHCPSK